MNAAKILNPLQDAFIALRNRRDPKVVVQIILHVACRLANAVHGSFVRVDFQKDSLIIDAVYGSDWDLETQGYQMPIGSGITGTVAKTGKPYLCKKTSEDPIYIPLFSNVQSELAVPVWVRDRVWGIINLDGLVEDAFDEETVDVMMMFAELVAMAFTLDHELREYRALQEELIQSQKLASLGKVIAGIAHEINNPLTTILGHASLLQLSPTEPPDPVSLHAIISEAQRTAEIVKSLLDFSRKEAGELQMVSVQLLLEKITEIKRFQLTSHPVQLQVLPFETSLRLRINLQQIRQVLLNLVQNAEHALESTSVHPKKISIKVTSVGSHILIRVIDNGPGIPSEIKPYIFDPFVSTKGAKGTGIGLSMCHTLMSAHQGRIYLENTSNEGTIFVVEFPNPDHIDPREKLSATSSILLAQNEEAPWKKILLVDDEQSILEYLSKVCHVYRIKPVTALDGIQALEKIRAHGKFDAVISDIRMPHMNGLELYQRVMTDYKHYKSKFLFMSGDLKHQGTMTQIEKTGCPFIEKPFTPQALHEALTPLLEEPFVSQEMD